MTIVVKNQQIFPRLIFKSHYNGFNFEDLLPVCQNLIQTALSKHNSYLELGDAQSSVMFRGGAPHKLSIFKPFYEWLTPQVEEIMFSEWKFTPAIEYWISDSWVNRHGVGGKTDTHNHGNAAMSVVAYLNVPRNSGRIEFLDPNEKYWNFFAREVEPGEFYPVDIETGDVLMFPGWIDHRTEIHTGNKSEDRWVLTTNFSCFKLVGNSK